MKQFINMDFNGSQWWVEYIENEVVKKEFFNTESQAQSFYLTLF